ncbi:MAG TPA: hypothetical protein VD735_02360 [Candidatus Saccharimonadales bacterium]|nr:hypothetical protein [Candidatus Saccharimonadales bacterium]
MFKNILNRIKRASSQKMVVGGAFVIAMVAAAGLGFATKQFTSAAVARDCDDNAIMRCGADDVKEFISDAKSNNGNTQKVQSDIQGIYNHYGLSTSEYTRFEQTAQVGTVYADGRIVVNGQTVATGATSLGRQSFGKPANVRKATPINGKTYYASSTKDSFAKGTSSLPAMVMFDSKGQVEFAALMACGNPVWGNKVTPEYSCKSLNQTAVAGKANTYRYTTTVGSMKNATVNKVVYNFGDGSAPVEKKSPSDAVEHTFTKSSTVTVTVYFNVPGKGVVAATVVTNCKKAVKVTPPPAPYYACVALTAVARNEEKTEFRVSVKTNQGNGAVLKDVDFTFNNVTTTGVTAKDASGNIYKDFTVAKDGKEYTVAAKVNFNVANAVQSKNCVVKIQAEKAPVCEIPGKEMYPPNAPECAYCEVPGYENLPKDSDKCFARCDVPGYEHLPKDSPDCAYCPVEGKQDLPKDSTECVETPETPVTPEVPEELPHTGIGSAFGLFAGVTAAGAAGHHLINRRKRQ